MQLAGLLRMVSRVSHLIASDITPKESTRISRTGESIKSVTQLQALTKDSNRRIHGRQRVCAKELTVRVFAGYHALVQLEILVTFSDHFRRIQGLCRNFGQTDGYAPQRPTTN